MKKVYNIVVIILVYRNTKDLKECVISMKEKIPNSKIIIVNAYFDSESEHEANIIAEKYNCDFINVENLGYSFGNNRGIEYAQQHYEYRYIAISNPDIVVKKFPSDVTELGYDIIAPKIVTLSGKMQNPMIPKKCKTAEKSIYKGFKENKKIFFYIGLALNKIIRCGFLIKNKILPREAYKIYAAHGSFVLLSSYTVGKIGKNLYDEHMFLFAEESVLAYKAKQKGIDIVFMPEILMLHKEDGCMKLSNISTNEEMMKSNIYYYEHYITKDGQ